MKSALFTTCLICLTSCGDLTVGGQENVVVSGGATITYQISVANLINYFTASCQDQLGLNATQMQIDNCVNTEVLGLINSLPKSN